MMQATIDGFTPQFMQDVVKRYDYQNEPGFEGRETIWIDYAADTGDGFDSTFAIASLIAADSLDVEGAGKLPGGKNSDPWRRSGLPLPDAVGLSEPVHRSVRLRTARQSDQGT